MNASVGNLGQQPTTTERRPALQLTKPVSQKMVNVIFRQHARFPHSVPNAWTNTNESSSPCGLPLGSLWASSKQAKGAFWRLGFCIAQLQQRTMQHMHCTCTYADVHQRSQRHTEQVLCFYLASLSTANCNYRWAILGWEMKSPLNNNQNVKRF